MINTRKLSSSTLLHSTICFDSINPRQCLAEKGILRQTQWQSSCTFISLYTAHFNPRALGLHEGSFVCTVTKSTSVLLILAFIIEYSHISPKNAPNLHQEMFDLLFREWLWVWRKKKEEGCCVGMHKERKVVSLFWTRGRQTSSVGRNFYTRSKVKFDKLVNRKAICYSRWGKGWLVCGWKGFNLVKEESMKIRRTDRQWSKERNNRSGEKKEGIE